MLPIFDKNQGPAQLKLKLGDHLWQADRPVVMGILNVTPDSFSDGGHYLQLDRAVEQARQMGQAGARIVDVGGESTRPGATPVSTSEEMDRVLPVVQALAREPELMLSIDTSNPEVFAACWAVRPCLWNDVRALRRPGARQLAAKLGCPVVLMHHRGEPDQMNARAQYQNVVDDIIIELDQDLQAALMAGIHADQILIDPGFGFAKNASQNLQLLGQLHRFSTLGRPLLVGISRKRVLGEVLGGVPADQRLHAAVAAAVLAVQQGAWVVRTHDVRPTVDALALVHAVRLAQPSNRSNH